CRWPSRSPLRDSVLNRGIPSKTDGDFPRGASPAHGSNARVAHGGAIETATYRTTEQMGVESFTALGDSLSYGTQNRYEYRLTCTSNQPRIRCDHPLQSWRPRDLELGGGPGQRPHRTGAHQGRELQGIHPSRQHG